MTVQFALSPASRAAAHSVGPVMAFGQDREIYGEGEDAGVCYKVLSGVVRTCKFLADGRRQIDAFHVAGDLFGLEPGSAHSLSAEAVSDCRVVALRRSAEQSSSPLFLTQIIRNLARAREHALLLGRRCAAEKVAAFLLGWEEQSAAEGIVTLAMTRQDIGDYLGLTIETVSRTLSQFERDGIIDLPSARLIRIEDADALAALCD